MASLRDKTAGAQRVALAALLLIGSWMGLATESRAEPARLVATRRAVVYEDSKPGLTSDKKQKLQIVASDRAVNPSFFVVPGETVQVLSPAQFDVREVLADVKTGQAFKEMKVLYSCALVQAVGGPNAGKRGWIVISREVQGRYKDSWFEAEPAP